MSTTPTVVSKREVMCMSRFKLMLGAAVVVAAVALSPMPAYAHDSIVGSDPAPGAALEVAPEQVMLEFSGQLLELGDSGAFVIVADVADADDRDWVASPPVIDGRSVTAELTEGMPAGAYEVRWQVVSQDGHPISGVVPFTVTVGQPMPEQSTGAEPPADPPVAEDTADESADDSVGADQTEGEEEDQSVMPVILIALVGAALLAAALAVILFMRSRKTGATDSAAK